jgi:hypothetical protein
MSQVVFEDNDFHIRSRRIFGEPETPTMVKFLLNHGIAKNEKQALYILIGVIIVSLLIPFYILFHNLTTSDVVRLKNGKIIEIHEFVRKLKTGEK